MPGALIGLTGGIGSGKTAVAELLSAKGWPVYNSDHRAKEVVHDNLTLRNSITNLLGEDAYTADGRYNTTYVASRVFNSPALLAALNALIHPAVAADFAEWMAAQEAALVFKETALLFELGLYLNCDATILVTADDAVRIARVQARDGRTEEEVRMIMERQMPEAEKRSLANYVIENNSTLTELAKKTDEVLSSLQERFG